jgi:primosomal protein N' (replication factor Y) (superfamily II helicase)
VHESQNAFAGGRLALEVKVKSYRIVQNIYVSMRTHQQKILARVALDVPIAPWFDYEVPPELAHQLQPFDCLLVPWGKGRKVGLFLEYVQDSELAPEKLKVILSRLDQAPSFPKSWQELVRFAARYYQRSLGEIALPTLPKPLRLPPKPMEKQSVFERVQKRIDKASCLLPPPVPHQTTDLENDGVGVENNPQDVRALTTAQQKALATLCESETGLFQAFLLFGVTGSGKTELYLRWIEHLLIQNPRAQVLLLIPEIALTPRLLQLIRLYFPEESIAVLHSELADLERAAAWTMAARGESRIVIGTRLSVFTPLPGLAGIVVDEEHDPSFKQPDAAFYSARDLALVLASVAKVPIVLGSATPSLESWQAAQNGRYKLLELKERATGASLPNIILVKPAAKEAASLGFSTASAEAIDQCLARGQQALVFLNRRGYAPVLYCMHCGWLSQCDACSAYRVLHKLKSGYRLICHHCSQEQRVPRQCPGCGAAHLEPLGQGTQGLEQSLKIRFPAARLRRVDRDVAKRKGAVEEILQEVHAGDADLLVGTQMLAKGHDFQNLNLVVVLDCDGALYSGDFRARERLFATLMQVSGRAGRIKPSPNTPRGTVLIETRFADDPLFKALIAQDYVSFATQELSERQQVAFPPFQYHALLRVRALAMPEALAWLAAAKQGANALIDAAKNNGEASAQQTITLHDPVPMPLAKLAHYSRAQLLIESRSRKVLQAFVRDWLELIRTHTPPAKRDLSWQLEVDPIEI